MHRFPKSIHCQVEAVFHAIRAIRSSKSANVPGIRSFGAWVRYRREAHLFARYLAAQGGTSLLDTPRVACELGRYLDVKLRDYAAEGRSRQTLRTMLSALAKMEFAINAYVARHHLPAPRLETADLRRKCGRAARTLLPATSQRYALRSYPDPKGLIKAIEGSAFQLQAELQYQGGLRAEGVGAPHHKRLRNPLTPAALRGFVPDPVTGETVGMVRTREKGGKLTDHFVPVDTYWRLDCYLRRHGELATDYDDYRAAVNAAARATEQFAPGRGTHGLKHNFCLERYLEGVLHGMSHEQALQQVALEAGHFRMLITLTYTYRR